MRSAPAVTEIATSHFPPRQTLKIFFDVNDLRGALPSHGCSSMTTQIRYQRGSRGWRTDSL